MSTLRAAPRNGSGLGGGIYALGTSPRVVDNIFDSNTGEVVEGFGSSMVLQRNPFKNTLCSVNIDSRLR